ncbi:hypothetical protein BC332_15914 [Capsicum chinense]|nr:hypothetical protein BC332_15914 [Capsicum chinense]
MHWKLKVLVVRLWEVKDRFNPDVVYAIEMGAFVLCCLFKKSDLKKDEDVENSNLDVEQNASVAKSPTEDELSEEATLLIVVQPLVDSDKIYATTFPKGELYGKQIPIDINII